MKNEKKKGGGQSEYPSRILGGYRFNVYFDRKEMDEKRKEKRENTEAKNQFEK